MRTPVLNNSPPPEIEENEDAPWRDPRNMANRSEVCQIIFRKTCGIGGFYWPIICSFASEGCDVLSYSCTTAQYNNECGIRVCGIIALSQDKKQLKKRTRN